MSIVLIIFSSLSFIVGGRSPLMQHPNLGPILEKSIRRVSKLGNSMALMRICFYRNNVKSLPDLVNGEMHTIEFPSSTSFLLTIADRRESFLQRDTKGMYSAWIHPWMLPLSSNLRERRESLCIGRTMRYISAYVSAMSPTRSLHRFLRSSNRLRPLYDFR